MVPGLVSCDEPEVGSEGYSTVTSPIIEDGW
jgi:hypothetical protein